MYALYAPNYVWQPGSSHLVADYRPTNPSADEHTYTTVLQPFYTGQTCLNRHHRLGTGGFCLSKVLLLACPCYRSLDRLRFGFADHCAVYKIKKNKLYLLTYLLTYLLANSD